MATIDDVERIALGLPGVEEGKRWNHRTWNVDGKAFIWERPFSKADIKRFGDQEPPSGPILALTVDDPGEKEAILGADPAGFFTIVHFDNYPAYLIQLSAVDDSALQEAIVDAWMCCAPAGLATAYADEHSPKDGD